MFSHTRERLASPLLVIMALFTALLATALSGCGGTGSGGAGSTGSITITDASGAAGETLRISGTDALGNVQFQPVTVTASSEVSLDQVPTGVTSLLVERLQDGKTIGVYSRGVSLQAGSTTTLAASDLSKSALKSISVTPGTASIADGTSQPFVATGIFADKSSHDVTHLVTWSTSSPTVASHGGGGVVKGLQQGTVTVTAETVVKPVSNGKIPSTNGTRVVGSASLNVTQATLTSIQVSPGSASVPQGLSVQFSAIGHYSNNTTQDLTAQVAWFAVRDGFVTFSTETPGLAATGIEGHSSIEASFEGVAGSTTLTVTAAVPTSLHVVPGELSLPRGRAHAFRADARYTDGSERDVTEQAAWTSSNPDALAVSDAEGSKGVASALEIGESTVTASFAGFSGSTPTAVTAAVLDQLVVSPAGASIPQGTDLQLTATGIYSDGHDEDLTEQATWTSTNSGVVSVSSAAGSKGLATGTGTGTASVQAQLGDILGDVAVEGIAPVLRSIRVEPDRAVLPKGKTLQLMAWGIYSAGPEVDLTDEVAWTTTSSATATVTNGPESWGRLTAQGVGTATVTAARGTVRAELSVEVTPAVLESLIALAESPSVAAGHPMRLIVAGHMSDGTYEDLSTTAQWTSGDPSIAIIDQLDSGEGPFPVVRGVSPGTVQLSVEATLNGVTLHSEISFTVTEAVLTGLRVSPTSTSVFPGATSQLTAFGTFSDGEERDVTGETTWTSSEPGQAAVSTVDGSRGLVTAVSPGSAVITATAPGGSLTATCTVTVEALSPDVQRVSVSSAGQQTFGRHISESAVSANGRFVAWSQQQSTGNEGPVAGDNNGMRDVFVRDLVTGTTELASATTAGGFARARGFDGNLAGSGEVPAISGDGRYVVFYSNADLTGEYSNLTGYVSSLKTKLVVRDRVLGKTEIVCSDVGSFAANYDSLPSPKPYPRYDFEKPSITPDGRYIAFRAYTAADGITNTGGKFHVFVHDQVAKRTYCASRGLNGAPADGHSFRPAISSNDGGVYVAFPSLASNLVSGDTNGKYDVFCTTLAKAGDDLYLQGTERVSVSSTGQQAMASAQFTDPTRGAASGYLDDGSARGVSVSGNGRFVTFVSHNVVTAQGALNWTLGATVLLRDRQLGRTQQVSLNPTGGVMGECDSPTISEDGRYVAFQSERENLGDVSYSQVGTEAYIHDVYVRDLAAGQTRRVSVRADGTLPKAYSRRPTISADGSRIIYLEEGWSTSGDSIVMPDNNAGWNDAFLVVNRFLFP